jgi:hypothetical protein
MHYRDVLADALKITTQRGQEYGDSRPSFVRAANIWSIWRGQKMTAFDVAACLMAVKMSRLAHQPTHQDSWIDLAAYVAFCAQFAGPHTSDFDDVVRAQVQADMEEGLRDLAKSAVQKESE